MPGHLHRGRQTLPGEAAKPKPLCGSPQSGTETSQANAYRISWEKQGTRGASAGSITEILSGPSENDVIVALTRGLVNALSTQKP